MIRRSIFISLFSILFFSCASVMEVTNILDTQEVEADSKLYILPKTVVSIDVTVVRKSNYPGPYAKFASNFLGRKNVITQKSSEWEISDFAITSYEIEDKKHFYVLTENKKSDFSFTSYIDKGLIFPLNNISSIADLQRNPSIKEPESVNLFPDFLMKDNLVEREKNVYETVSNDSTSYTVLKKKKLYSSKTLEEKAEDAADLLIRLRKRRFKLLASIEKTSLGDQARQFAKEYPDGSALKQMLSELNKLESEIIASFEGKSITEKFIYHYQYTPVVSMGKYKLFSFSEKEGILPPEEELENEYTIRYNLEHNTSELGKLVNKKDEVTFNAPVVRIADYANFIIDKNNEYQASKRLKIFQFGSIVSIKLVH